MTSIESKFREIVVDKLGVDERELQPWANFEYDLGADSIDKMELIMEFEKEFEISIPDDVAVRISTVGDAIDYLKMWFGDSTISTSSSYQSGNSPVSTGIKTPNENNGKSGLKNG